MDITAEKKKIFISAHPADRYEYLDRIAEVIEECGCNALYNDSPSDKGPYLPFGIDTMIIVASVKYFIWANSGYESEYFAAVRDGVRVIPFLIENDVNAINLINTRCSKVQYIDASTDINSALEELRSYLHPIEAKKNRALPSVFISYRRADSEHLRKLVEIIESANVKDKVNVWYDEAIAPGDKYSESILDELRECDLFILLITPNILEPKNYVWRVEYKTARKLRKRVVAIMAEKTDKNVLYQMYGSLGHIIDMKHTDAITSAVRELTE